MIRTKKAFSELTDQEYRELVDLPIWISLLAAYEHDGKIDKDERAEAIRIAHLRSFDSPYDIRDYALQVYRDFDHRFRRLDEALTGEDGEKKVEEIRAKIQDIYVRLVPKIEPSVVEDLFNTLESFYRHVFVSNRSFLQYFALPIVSNRLDKRIGEDRFFRGEE